MNTGKTLFAQLMDFLPWTTFALLTGARKTNVLEMQWDQVNLERGTWEIPITKNGEAQTVPLTREAVTLLTKRDHRNGVEGATGCC